MRGMSRPLVIALIMGVLAASSCSEQSEMTDDPDSGEVTATAPGGDGGPLAQRSSSWNRVLALAQLHHPLGSK